MRSAHLPATSLSLLAPQTHRHPQRLPSAHHGQHHTPSLLTEDRSCFPTRAPPPLRSPLYYPISSSKGSPPTPHGLAVCSLLSSFPSPELRVSSTERRQQEPLPSLVSKTKSPLSMCFFHWLLPMISEACSVAPIPIPLSLHG